MDSFDNPEHFQNSSIVQKSSKTGIFSNKRLLVIKNGYLYYFSKVPKGYKSHVPNILTTFTDLPKSSIEIKNILEIRLQSAKSSNLIIKFYLKDMIDRQDIRKSIDSQLYSMPNKKVNNETDEWKFMFTTVLQCRLWYNALMKLKEYFRKLEINFKDFVANFDPKRTSVSIGEGKEGRSQSQLKFSLASNQGANGSFNQGSSSMIGSEKSRKTEPIKFDASKFIGSVAQKQSSQSSQKSSQINLKQSSPSPRRDQLESKAQKLQPSNVISEQDQGQQNGAYHPNISHKIEPQIPEHYETGNMKKTESFKSTLKQSHMIIEPINEQDQFKIKQMQDDIRQEVKQEVQKQVRQEVQKRLREQMERQKKQEMRKHKIEMDVREMKIKQLETEIHINHLTNMEKQKVIEEERRRLEGRIVEEQMKLDQVKGDLQRQIVRQQQGSKHQQTSKNPPTKSNHQPINPYKNQWQGMASNNNSKWQQAGDDYELAAEQQQQKQQNKQHKTFYEDETYNDKPKPISSLMNHVQVQQFSVQTDEEQNTVINLNSSEDSFERAFHLQSSKEIGKENHHKGKKSRTISDRLKVEQGILTGQQSQSYNTQEQFQSYDYFYELNRLFEPNISSQQRIARQSLLLQYINHTQQTVTDIVKDHIDSNRPQKCQYFEKQLYSFDLACAPGKIMNIGGENKLIYSNKAHQALKRTYKVYQKLQQGILQVMKLKGRCKVRVPLCTLVEYRGYTVLAKLEMCSGEQDSTHNVKEKHLKHILEPVHYSNVHLCRTISSFRHDKSSKGLQEDLYIVKVIKPFKITSTDDANSELFSKLQNDFSHPLTQIIYCRNLNTSVSYEKLQKQLQQSQSQDQSSGQKDASKLKQILQNQRYVLKMIRLMRELKKVFKSMQPYGQNLQRNQSLKKSQFVDMLLTNPQQLISLIPSDIDYTSVNLSCGYFYSLLQFFLGIRVNCTARQTPTITDDSYSLLPITRTFHLNCLFSVRYISKLPKYLSLNNLQAAQSCLKLLAKITPALLLQDALKMQIKLLLKRKQYSLAEQKIYALREILPLHDLRNIELNAYLIECFVFDGLETEALKEIRASLEYVEYMFGGRGNVFQQNLHLLMAETLLKMGNSKESIKLYKSLLKHDKIEKEDVLLSFGETLVNDHRYDPNETIPFLLEFIGELNDAEKKIELLICIAKLYQRSKRKDKCMFYLGKAYELGMKEKCSEKLLVVYDLLMNEEQNDSVKLGLYERFVDSMRDNKFWNREQNCTKFNTINLYHRVRSQEAEESQCIINNLASIMKQLPMSSVSSSVELKDWESIENCSNFLFEKNSQNFSKNQQKLKKVIEVLQSVNYEMLHDLLMKNGNNE